MNIKQLLQDQADTAKAIKALKKEGRELSALDKPTDEQSARLKAILGTELSALEQKAEDIEAALVNARRLQDDERKQPGVQVGANHAEDKPATLGEVMQA